jgi:hypothetical protein
MSNVGHESCHECTTHTPYNKYQIRLYNNSELDARAVLKDPPSRELVRGPRESSSVALPFRHLPSRHSCLLGTALALDCHATRFLRLDAHLRGHLARVDTAKFVGVLPDHRQGGKPHALGRVRVGSAPESGVAWLEQAARKLGARRLSSVRLPRLPGQPSGHPRRAARRGGAAHGHAHHLYGSAGGRQGAGGERHGHGGRVADPQARVS